MEGKGKGFPDASRPRPGKGKRKGHLTRSGLPPPPPCPLRSEPPGLGAAAAARASRAARDGAAQRQRQRQSRRVGSGRVGSGPPRLQAACPGPGGEAAQHRPAPPAAQGPFCWLCSRRRSQPRRLLRAAARPRHAPRAYGERRLQAPPSGRGRPRVTAEPA